jgi:hypothetical protein
VTLTGASFQLGAEGEEPAPLKLGDISIEEKFRLSVQTARSSPN